MRSRISSLLLLLWLLSAGCSSHKEDFYSMLERARNLDEAVDFTALRQAYAASPDFNPYPYSETKKNSRDLFNLLAGKKYHRVIEEDAEILLQNHLDVLAHKALAVAFEKVGNEALAQCHNFIAQGLLRSLVNSGDGQSAATAFRVISVDEEYALLHLLELGEDVEQQSLMEIDSVEYDVLTVRKSKTDTTRKCYFNIAVPSMWLSANMKRKIYCDSVAELRARSIALFKRHDNQAALDTGEDALKTAVQNLDARDPEITLTQLSLGGMYAELRVREGARDRLTSARKMLEEKYGDHYLQLAFVHIPLALSAGKEKEFEVAEEAYRLAMKIVEGNLGKENSIMADIENGLTRLYVDAKRYAQAEQHARNTLRLAEIIHGQGDLETAADINNLAEALRLQNRYAEAESLYHKAIVIKENVLGKNHSRLLVSLENLAILYGTMQRHKEAEALCVRCLAIAVSTYGPEHAEAKYFKKMIADLQSAQEPPQ